MSVFTSLIIVLLAMLIQSFLELSPGVFAIFYHYNLGKTTAKKADDQALSFILGTEICVAIVFLATYITTNFFITKDGKLDPIFIWTMSGIFLLEAIFSFFFYYKPARFQKLTTKKALKNSTMLFLPRSFASSLIYHIEHTKNRSSTIILGLVTCALELILTLPLYIIVSICIYYLSPNSNSVFIIAYIILATIPLFAIRTFFRTDHNLADIERLRVKKKLPTKFVISISYLVIAIVTLIVGFSL